MTQGTIRTVALSGGTIPSSTQINSWPPQKWMTIENQQMTILTPSKNRKVLPEMFADDMFPYFPSLRFFYIFFCGGAMTNTCISQCFQPNYHSTPGLPHLALTNSYPPMQDAFMNATLVPKDLPHGDQLEGLMW